MLNIVVIVGVVVVGTDRSEAADAVEMMRTTFSHEGIFQTWLARTSFVLNCYSG